MKPGKISENVLKRSVLKYVQVNTEEITKGAGIGNDCALFASGLAAATDTLSLAVSGEQLMTHAIYAAVNDLAASGQRATGILLNISLPERAREIKLQQMMEAAAKLCEQLSLSILGGHTEVTDAVSRAVVSVTAVGLPIDAGAKANEADRAKELAGCDIVVTKYIGMEAANLIARAREEELLTRFPQAMLEEGKGYEKYFSILPEAATAVKSGVCLMHDIREGGIFGALWEMAQGAGVGLIIDLKKIPMKQTVVEFCNYYDLNPYEILSTGCVLMAAADGDAMVGRLAEEGIEAAVIGKITNGNDRVVMNGEEKRFLDLPKPDQIRKLL